jgi:hypothetical protein
MSAKLVAAMCERRNNKLCVKTMEKVDVGQVHNTPHTSFKIGNGHGYSIGDILS